MQRQPVSSGNLKSVGYDAQGQVLEIEFHHGAVNQYLAVPQAIHNALMSAHSKGTYCHAHIRSVYRDRKIG